MTIASLDDLLRAAAEQPEPPRLLFVFATAGVDADATAKQGARFEAGHGGTLTPLMCVDKLPGELARICERRSPETCGPGSGVADARSDDLAGVQRTQRGTVSETAVSSASGPDPRAA